MAPANGVSTSIDAQEAMQCGYIKAKFQVGPGGYLGESPAYRWCRTITKPRLTENFIYVSLGHSLMPSNDIARQYLRQIAFLEGKVTRLDFCVDYLGKFAFDSFYEIHDNGVSPSPCKFTSPAGATVYVGKRSSARMLRVYDKRGEILKKTKADIGFELTRFELEIKRSMLHRYLVLFMSGKTDVILADMQNLYKLHGFCSSHEISKPFDVPDKQDDVFVFVNRYKRVIKEAYVTDKQQFLDIIGESEQ